MLTRDGFKARWIMEKEWEASSIVSGLEAEFETAGPARKVKGVSSIHQASAEDLAFCWWEGEKGAAAISRSQAGIILCKKSLSGIAMPNPDSQLVFLNNPRLVFVHFVNRVHNEHRADTTTHLSRARIGDNCRIGEHALIGDNSIIGSNVVIEERASLKNCRIGDGCIIQSGASIGSDGFAYERYPDGRLERFPHLGAVVLGKNVEISANCSITRGSLSDTTIGDGTKLDALVHVAHNVQIGRDCQLAAGTIIGGSTTLGDSCWTGLNSTLKDQICIGNSVLVAAGACVIGNVPDGDIVAGVPAKSIKHKVKTDQLFIMTGRKPGTEPASHILSK